MAGRRPWVLPNTLTWMRLAFVPVLWVLAFLGYDRAVAIGLVIAASTDFLDGWIARRTGTQTEFGSALDARADHMLMLSTGAFVVLLRPEFIREQFVPLAVCLGLGLVVLAVGWVRRRGSVDLHLWSSKVAGFAAYGYAAVLFYFGDFSRSLFALTMAIAYLAMLEALVVLLTRREVDQNLGTILLPRRRHTA